MKKIVLSFMFCLLMCLLLMPTTVFAADIASGAGWNLSDDGVLHITGAVSGGFGLTYAQKLQVTSAVTTPGASISSGNQLFYGFENMTSADLSDLDTGSVISMYGMFAGCSSLTALDLSGFDTGSVTSMEYMFLQCNSLTSLDVSGFDTGSVIDMGRMFYNCNSLTTLDVSGFDTGKVTNMTGMFDNCSGLTSLDLSGFDTGSVISMDSMFAGCSSLTALDLSGFDTGSVISMDSMFAGCFSLTALDLSGFDTGSVISMDSMFSSCIGLTALDLSGFDTGKVTDMDMMFVSCHSLTALDLSGFDTGSVISMGHMFYGCNSLTSLDVSGFDTGSVTNMEYMFYNCSSLTSLGIRPDILTKNVFDIIAIRSPWQKQGTTDLYYTTADLQAVTNNLVLCVPTSYTVTVQNDGNGTASADKTSAIFNETVTLSAAPNTGYHFKEWQSSDVTVAGDTFAMPAKNVTVKAVFEVDPLTGTVTITGTAKYNETLTASVTDTNNTGILSYQWERDGSAITGATADTYTLTADDVGRIITVSVSSSVESGTITSAASPAVEKADGPAAPAGLTAMDCTTIANDDGRITGTTSAMEYSTDSAFSSGVSCSGTEITGLSFGTYYVRIAETATHKAGEAAALIVKEFFPTITFDANGGSVTPASDIVGADHRLASLPVPVHSDDSYSFNGWYTEAVNGSLVTAGKVFTEDATIYAHWKYIGGSHIFVTYTLSFNTNGGSEIGGILDIYGTVVDLGGYVPEKSGYDFGGWYADPALTRPVDEIRLTDNATVYAKWIDRIPFGDIRKSDPFYDDAVYMYNKGLMVGVSDTEFAPYTTLSRGMIVTILYRLEGEPAFTNDNIFTDVEDGSWYEKAVVWANGSGIVLGYGDGIFGPDDPVTREQMAAILYRYAQYRGYDVTIDENTKFTSFDDVSDISEYAQAPMFWALDNGLIDDENGRLYPADNATRAVVAAFFHRFCEAFAK